VSFILLILGREGFFWGGGRGVQGPKAVISEKKVKYQSKQKPLCSKTAPRPPLGVGTKGGEPGIGFKIENKNGNRGAAKNQKKWGLLGGFFGVAVGGSDFQNGKNGKEKKSKEARSREEGN